ncbi:hypothetical protein A6768_12250 [Sphingobium yanoikuyae]|uniref:Uncharacterized protein n=1 Tax=Sphingobium yanoikuyae TaxID=13690 RepID=A0A291N000_SPHYA|nr:hypothetical protein A6768_12250 [Sphingobium yanoikuyae]
MRVLDEDGALAVKAPQSLDYQRAGSRPACRRGQIKETPLIIRAAAPGQVDDLDVAIRRIARQRQLQL